MQTKSFFTTDELSQLHPANIPQHIAIIPDGNRRWATGQAKTQIKGHIQGASGLMDIIRAGKELGINTFTIYTFSTENWNRDPLEIRSLMWLIKKFLKNECNEMVKEGVRFGTIGDISAVPYSLQKTITETKNATEQCDTIRMILAINYGSRNEITRALNRIIDDYSEGRVQKEKITESLVGEYLDTAPWGDPDLLIRTSGEMRVSNYLLWQISYAEIYVTETLWPDFSPHHLLAAVKHYQLRERRKGA